MQAPAPASPKDPLSDPRLPPGRRILLLGEHLGRIRQLAEAMIRCRCRVELVALPRHFTEADLTPETYAFTLVDSIGIGRSAIEMLESLRRGDQTVPLIAIGSRDAARHRLAGAPTVPARVDPDGFFADVAAVADAVITTWEAVRPLHGPAELRVDRVILRASVRGRQLTLRPFDYRLLVLLAERGADGATIEELVESAWSGRQVELRRAASVARQGLERLRSAFRRAGITIVSGADARYRLAARLER